MGISIRWIEGGRHASAADEARAIAAAEAALRAAGVSALEAAEAHEYSCRHASPSVDRALERLAEAWETATSAANVAATQGWHNPNGGAVELIAWRR
jgi:hypothetical protein